MTIEGGRIAPKPENFGVAGKLRDQRRHFGAAGDREIAAALRSARDVAHELDRVAETLIGDEQQRAVVQHVALPVRLVGGRHRRRHAGHLEAPLELLPPGAVVAVEQQRFAQLEMRAGVVRRQRDDAAETRDRVCDLAAIVVHEAEIIMRVAIVRTEFGRAAAVTERLVELALYATHFAEVAMTHGRIGALRKRALDGLDRLRNLAASEMGHARTVQRMACVLVDIHPSQSCIRARRSSVRGSE